MSSDAPSAGRFTRWAITLVLPMILAAAAMPWVLEKIQAARHAVPPTLAHAPPEDAPAATATAPRHQEAPTPDELQAARAAEAEAARIQQRNLSRSTTLAPREASLTPDGERIAPFQGFGLSVESSPAGARVLVAGRDVGETPIVTTVDCAPGASVEVVVERRGFRPARRTVRCRADALLELAVPLVR